MELASPATRGGSVNRNDIFYAITYKKKISVNQRGGRLPHLLRLCKEVVAG